MAKEPEALGRLGLSRETALDMYYHILLARRLDDRQWKLQRAGRLPFVISCQGQEAAQVGAAFAFDRPRDYALPYYRDLGVVLAWGSTARDVMLAAMAKKGDPASGARQMPSHWGNRQLNIVSGSSPVSTQVPHAVGMAWAAKMRKEDVVAYTSFGEGSANQGDVHEAMNVAGIHRIGVIFHCENNEYAISVPLERQVAGRSIANRAAGYGFPGVEVDGADVLAVYAAFKEAVERARKGQGPTLIESKCARLVPHSSDDDDKTYRPREELEAMKRTRDPVEITRRRFGELGILDDKAAAEIEARVEQVIDDATEYAEAAPEPDPEDALGHVYAEEGVAG